MRLINLKPGGWNDKIECDLEVVGLGERVKFEALSYVWGKRFSEQPVYINGHPRRTTANLLSALRHFRHRSEIKPLWVDAISINQSDELERNQQVKLMRKIYTECSGVLIWLGDHPDSFKSPDQSPCVWTTTFGSFYETPISNTDRQHLKEFGQSFSRYYNKPRAFRFDQQQDFTKGALCFLHILARDSHYNDETVPFFQSDDCRRNVIKALHDIMEQQWWDRMWVIQETVLPKKAILYYGRYSFPWEMLTEAAKYFHIHREGSCCSTQYAKLPSVDRQTIVDFANKVGDLARWRKVWQKHPDSKVFLLQLLRQFRRRDTTDAKDKVYSLIPLVTAWGKAEHMEVHYEWTDAQVYHLLVRHLIEVSENILVLTGTTEKSPELKNELPSWVPDWTVKGDEHELARLLRTTLYKASGDETLPVLRYLGLGKYLELEGSMHDIVSEKVGNIMPAGEEPDILQVFAEWHDLAGMRHPYHRYADRDIKRYNAWWRTLCMDTVFNSAADDETSPLDQQEYERAGKDYGKEYLSWRFDDTRPLQSPRLVSSKPLFELDTDPILFGGDTMELDYLPQPQTPPPRLHRTKTFKISPRYVPEREFPEDEHYQPNSSHPRKRYKTTPPRTNRESPILDGERVEMVAAEEAITTATTDRRFFLTEKGYMGLGPKSMRKGDVVFILRGGQVPFLLRPAGRENVHRVGEVDTHVLVGDCYVHGIMDGEAVPESKDGWKKLYLV